jgi:hypothetical protein
MSAAKKKGGEGENKYFVLDSGSPDMMLFFPPPNPSLKDRWMAGKRFSKPPQEPIVVKIRPDNENGDLLPYFNAVFLMSDEFHQALREAGVDNLDVYDAIIRSQDGSIERRGYKVFNLLGVVRAADLEKTQFGEGPQLIDATIETLGIDPGKARGLLMFRLAERVGSVIVHERVKRALESKNFQHVIFRDPGEFFGL